MTLPPLPLAPGSQAYWADRKAAFALIANLQAAIEQRDQAPRYIAGPGYDRERSPDAVLENLGPWNRVAALQDAALANSTVIQILTAQRRLDLLPS